MSPRSSTMDKTSRNSESAYEVDSTAFTLDENGFPWLRPPGARCCAEGDVGDLTGDGRSA